MSPPRLLSPDEVDRELGTLPGWQRVGDLIRKTFTLESFPEAVALAVEVGFAAEATDHHPDITISYRRITLAYTTHSAAGLTARDIAGARDAERIVASRAFGRSA